MGHGELGIGNWELAVPNSGVSPGVSFIVGEPDNYTPPECKRHCPEGGIGNWQCLILGFPPVCLSLSGNPTITHRQNARGTAPKGELGIGIMIFEF